MSDFRPFFFFFTAVFRNKRKYFVNTVTLPDGDCEIPRGRLKTHIVFTLGAKQANSYIFQSRSEILLYVV